MMMMMMMMKSEAMFLSSDHYSLLISATNFVYLIGWLDSPARGLQQWSPGNRRRAAGSRSQSDQDHKRKLLHNVAFLNRLLNREFYSFLDIVNLDRLSGDFTILP